MASAVGATRDKAPNWKYTEIIIDPKSETYLIRQIINRALVVSFHARAGTPKFGQLNINNSKAPISSPDLIFRI